VIEEREPYDAVLVDAPCTGTGVLARRPDLRWRRKPDDVPRMAATQLKLLSYAESKVALGGRIIYSTCSVEPEENLEVVNAFLQQHRGFGLETFSSNLDPGTLDEHGCLSYWGPELGADGVFAAVLRRKPLIIKSLAG
jgi:16S rRNA (cytosine967-C5)-methyltransferase